VARFSYRPGLGYDKMTARPHSRYQHVFVVLRIDEMPNTGLTSDAISAVSVFESAEAANAERDRLAALQRDVACEYFVLTSRLKDRPTT